MCARILPGVFTATTLVFALMLVLAPVPGHAGLAMLSHHTKNLPAKSIDRVAVFKSKRLLMLIRNGLVVDTYKIALGLAPVGDKTQRGDDKTPVGDYMLDWRNPNSRFHRSIHISYPDARDRAKARARGVSAGDNIMIHGQPDYDSRPRTGDWTHGCIAVSNAAINQIWRLVPDGTPISIYP